ncbi:predicted protein [Uncinocarpus reesii 1704]|uniref:Uncharacterized protein n=1 Tax=Uncinocarpus reesii (strain UAMH 1704) TaxID=336963 RepID=C4JF66_UNCRE|nr:uncharacterized protein UREG_02288 [Uncinocarpus reesii 1704]EEP77439.1 predicted protein [Uncinocarpus reesii 1704]
MLEKNGGSRCRSAVGFLDKECSFKGDLARERLSREKKGLRWPIGKIALPSVRARVAQNACNLQQIWAEYNVKNPANLSMAKITSERRASRMRDEVGDGVAVRLRFEDSVGEQ